MEAASSSSPNSGEDDQTHDTSFGTIAECATPPLHGLTILKSATSPAVSIEIPRMNLQLALLSLAETHKLPGSTIALELAKNNPVDVLDLRRGQKFDVHEFTPLFITGVLQLPGTLANALGYRRKSELELVSCMVPGRVFCPEDGTKDDGEIEYSNAETSVRGMIVLGRGKRNRHALDEWYGRDFIRLSLKVELQTWIRREVMAFTWVERKAVGLEVGHDDASDSSATSMDCERDCLSDVMAGAENHEGWAKELSTSHSRDQTTLADGLSEWGGWSWTEHHLDVVW